MVNVKNLIFEYPGKRVLHDISFDISPNTICALVGPNGAGKTTLLRCISALIRPYGGIVKIDGMNVHENPRKCHKNIAYLADFFGLYEKLTVKQSLTYMAQAYGIEKNEQLQAYDWVIEQLNLNDHINKKAGELSRGMRQRLGIAFAIIHKPQVVLLDEPASGLDPEARYSLSRLLVDLKNEGMTIIVSSHILAELEEYCDEMLIIRDGKLIEQKMGKTQPTNKIQVIIKAISPIEQILDFLNNKEIYQIVSYDSDEIHLELNSDERAMSILLKELMLNNFEISEFYKNTQSMQDVYLQTVNKANVT